MRRDQLEHAIRASTAIVRQDTVIVIGSQSILGTWDEDELPSVATRSPEVDICPLSDDDAESLADELDSIAGEWSQFHETHGFYIQGVGRHTAVLPDGWQKRLVKVSNDNTQGRTGLCLDPYDLCVAKLIAGRDKDLEFVGALLDARLISPDRLTERFGMLKDDSERAARALAWVAAVSRARPTARQLGRPLSARNASLEASP